MAKIQKINEKSLDNRQLFYNSSLETVGNLAVYGNTLKPLKKLFGNYILEQSLTLFPSERGTGKTFLGLQICIAISSQWESFCEEPIEIHGNTLFVNCELGKDVISRRIAKLFREPPRAINQDKFNSLIYTTRKSFKEETNNIISITKEYDPVLIILDNYRMAFLEADSNNNKEVAKCMNQILTLKDAMNTTILLTDHTRKHTSNLLTSSDLQSGGGAKSDLTDSDMFLRKSSQDKNYRILKRAKSRNCEESDSAKLLMLNQDTLWFECIDEAVNEIEHIGNGTANSDDEKKEIAKELREKGKSYDQIAQLLNTSKSKVYRWFN